MKKKTSGNYKWDNLRIGITGASGALGQSLIKQLKGKGAFVVGLTSTNINKKTQTPITPNKWINWECGNESKLDNTLASLDILILNHGINNKGSQTNNDINKSLEINFLSVWRLIERFEFLVNNQKEDNIYKEIWVNTSEAEIQPALSPTYEISKKILGEIVSIKMKDLNRNNKSFLRVRKIILGPFKSKLNPIGIMRPDFVARKIVTLVEKNRNLIIVTPNPITYFFIPFNEVMRFIYLNLTQRFNSFEE